MPNVGDRIAVASKGEPRSGVVTAISGVMISVKWDRGGETSIIPGPGVLSVVATAKSSSSRTKTGTKSGVAKKAAASKKKKR